MLCNVVQYDIVLHWSAVAKCNDVSCTAVPYSAMKRSRLSALECSEVKCSRVDGVGLE